MTDLALPVLALRAAGTAAGTVAAGVRSADLAGPTGALAAALPGSRTAHVAATAAEQWQRSVGGVADGMARHAAALSGSADAYASTEEVLRTSLAFAAPALGTAITAALQGPR